MALHNMYLYKQQYPYYEKIRFWNAKILFFAIY